MNDIYNEVKSLDNIWSEPIYENEFVRVTFKQPLTFDRDITIYGDGSQTRSFCYVDDLVEGMIKMMASDESITGPVNLGNPNEKTIKEIAESVIGLCGSKSKLIFMPLPQDDPTRRCPNISKAKQILNWEPKVELEEGLKKTIEYFKSIFV